MAERGLGGHDNDDGQSLKGQTILLLQIGEQRLLETVADVLERVGVGEDAEAALRREVGRPERVLRQTDVVVDDPVVETVELVVHFVFVVVAEGADLGGQLVGQSADAQQDQTELVVVGVHRQHPLAVAVPRRRTMGFHRDETLDDRVHAVGMGRTVLADGAVDEAQVLQQQQPPLVVQTIQTLETRVLLQLFRDFADVVLRHRSRRRYALELVEEVGVFQQQLLQPSQLHSITSVISYFFF